ncbi:arabinose utilization transcriptional regulator AraR [Salinibacillus aidingensis]|uniref:Arabinose utilization transcriptional regulator AraR n=1 Tax=Salinibacillus aidingensis TaxID=237684 RepID=A0ABN1AXG8_9BACI
METKYSIVKQGIKSKILDGTFTPHQKIGTESDLMKQFGVSRHTVRLAIGDLVNQGWLYREQGVGTFCADRSKQQSKSDSNQKNIAIITTYISDYIFPSIIRGAESTLTEEGYQVSLFSTNNDHEMERKLLEIIVSQSFDGVIIEPTKSAYSNPNISYFLNLERLSIPYIMINAYYDELEPLSILMDDEKGGFLQTEHLIKLGHKDILGFFKTDDIQGTKRMKGYLKAHRKYQIPINPNNIVTYSTTEKDKKPTEKLQQLLSSSQNKSTGLVCYNDELAIKLLDVLREKKIHVPDDLSIVGYDDSFLANVSEVKLTSIIHPKSKMGQEAAKTIIDLITLKESSKQNDLAKMDSIVYSPEIAIRSSTKNLNPREMINT